MCPQIVFCASSRYGVRDPTGDKYKQLAQEQPAASVASLQDAVSWGDAVIVAVPSGYDEATLKATAASFGPGIKGKVVLDAYNPLSEYPGLKTRILTDGGISAGEMLAAALPDSHVFKAFNTIGVEHMDAADGHKINGQQLTMLYAGPEEGRATAEEVISGVGFLPEYVGPIRYARNLEAIAELWIHLSFPQAGDNNPVNWGRNFHFQVIKKAD